MIDPFTVLAQVVNFLVLIVILKRFLYGPIIRAMEARERKIAARMEEAERAKNEATLQSVRLERERAALSSAKERLLAEAREEVQQWRATALEKARQETEVMRQAWRDSLEGEKDRFFQKLRTRIVEQVLIICRKVLTDLASGELEHQLVETFLKRVAAAHRGLAESGVRAGAGVLIRSGFALGDDLQTRLKRALGSLFSGAENITFAVEPKFGFGIQVVTGDWKVEWNLAWYLKGLETELLYALPPSSRRAA